MIVASQTNNTINLYYRANSSIEYTVNHYKQGINEDDYTLEYTEKLFGEMNTQVTPSTIDYDGFTSPNKQTITISTNGSNIVDYYYRRNFYILLLYFF